MASGSITEIPHEYEGRWLVETHSGSQHLFDLDDDTYARRGSDIGLPSGEVRSLVEFETWPKLNSRFRVWLEDDDESDQLVESSWVLRITRLAAEQGFEVELPPMSVQEAVSTAPPTNAWLLTGDDASFPDATDLREMRDSDDPSSLWDWTCPRQIQRGDLVFLYFMAPRKASHFVARTVLPPVYDPSQQVNANKPIDPHQWWTLLSPFVEIPPVPFARLKELHDGHLILRGKPTTYLEPDVVSAIVADLGDLTEEQRLVLQRPVGDAELPQGEVTLDELRLMSSGRFANEKMVEQYVVKPLLRLCFPAPDGFRIEAQTRIDGAGVADFTVHVGDDLIGVVEVKLGIRRQRDGGLVGSPDLAQLIRYARAADAPALLIDGNEIVMISRGDSEPARVISRDQLDGHGLKAIAGHFMHENIDDR